MKSIQPIKKVLIVFSFVTFCLMQKVSAQEWLISGNAGILSATNYLGTKDNSDLVFRTNSLERGRILSSEGEWHFGSNNDFVKIDSLGNLRFNGKGGYLVGNNQYVFRFSRNMGYGLFFNSTLQQYEFRSGDKTPIFFINANTGEGNFLSDSKIHGITIGLGGGSISTNLALGINTLYNNTTGNDNSAIGSFALLSNTTGSFNTANGNKALYSNTTGYFNTANGVSALYSNSVGSNNTANGAKALYSNTTGYFNTANGISVLSANTTGWYNTANGANALLFNTTGGLNTAYGANALYFNITGFYNSANGYSALFNNTTGEYNTADGCQALYNNKTGNKNTGLGYHSNVAANNLQNAMALGYRAIVNASNKVQVGNLNVTVIGGQVGWSTFSDGRFKKNIKQNVPGLEFINKLNPVTYTLEIKKFDRFLGKNDSIINSKESQEGYAVGEQKIRTGFIAQEVEKTAQEIGYDFDGINHPQNEKDNYSLVYADFVPSLVKAVQELNTNLQKQNDDLQKQIDELKIMVANLAQGKSISTTEVENKISLSSISLEQNIPNPLANSTSIGYFIPSNIHTAQLIVTDMSGKNIKQISLQNGKGNITIDASTLSAGAYNYSLMVNGKMVATKRMVVAH